MDKRDKLNVKKSRLRVSGAGYSSTLTPSPSMICSNLMQRFVMVFLRVLVEVGPGRLSSSFQLVLVEVVSP